MSQSKLVGVVETAVHGCRGFHVRLDHDCEMPKVGTPLYAAPQPTKREPAPDPVLVRDLAEIIGSTVPDICNALVGAGFDRKSTNMALTATEALKAAALIKERDAKREPCIWTQVDDEHTPDTWQGSCGAVWSFIDGGPADNGQRFCPRCGSECKEVRGEA